MSTIITQSGPSSPANLAAAARNRADRLSRVTAEQMETALGYLSVIDPEAFEIAFTAVGPDRADERAREELPGDGEPIPVCRRCGSLVGIFPDQDLDWQHFRGDGSTSGAQETYDPGHTVEVVWLLPDEDPSDL